MRQLSTAHRPLGLVAVLILLLAPLTGRSFHPGVSVDSSPSAVVIQTNDKIVIGGSFNTVNGRPRDGIARLNSDGSIDTNFNPVRSANRTVLSAAMQPDGKIVIGGVFPSVNGLTDIGLLERLNSNGSVDQSFDFDPSSGVDMTVNDVALQDDEKIIIGGRSHHNTPNGILRLNADGSVDQSFDPGSGTNGAVRAAVVQADGKIVIGGSFDSINGNSRNGIARLNTDGSVDTSFNPGSGANDSVSDLAVQSDGKVVIGGWFTSVDGNSRNRIARLNSDGSVDFSFNPGSGATNFVNTLAIQSDGKIVIGGFFISVNGVQRNRIARLNLDGSVDQSFDPGSGANNSVWSVAVQVDGKIIIGGILLL